MPTNTFLNTSPYFDDYDASKDFYRILFRPGVAVQTRELNQLQTIVQRQIERFGDNVFKRGTIVDGCNFAFYKYYPYAKIEDAEVAGAPVAPSTYLNLIAKNTANLQAVVINFSTGYETQDPDLNTLYFRYINSGNNNETSAFSAGDILTLSDANNIIHSVGIAEGASGFANVDAVHFVSSIAVQNTTGGTAFANGGFTIGDVIDQAASGSATEIVDVDTTAVDGAVVLRLRPLDADLANTEILSTAWNPVEGELVIANTTGATANVVNIIGSGAAGFITTDATGRVTNVTVTAPGGEYTSLPTVVVQSSTGAVGTLDLTPQTYLTQVTIATTANAVGSGYAFGVTEGIIYQKGHFLRVSPQTVIVDKYSSAPSEKVVGFDTDEAIINSNIDPTLLDNATGAPNEFAPGADRLQLTPRLVTLDKQVAVANSDFFSIVEFAEGRPFKQNSRTQYSFLEDEMARRTYDESGNYIIDPFFVNTRSPRAAGGNTALEIEANSFVTSISQGQAYILGRRAKTETSYEVLTDKGTQTATANAAALEAIYGNYIKVNELGGNFLFITGAEISLRDAAADYLTADVYQTSTTSVIPPSGNEIGTARIRSLTYDSGTPGTPGCVYRAYLFDISMNQGKNFSDVRSIHLATDDYDGVADIVLQTDPTTSANVAVLTRGAGPSLIIPTQRDALQSLANVHYQYRTVRLSGFQANTSGIITVTLSGDEEFPYLGILQNNEKNDLIVVPQSDMEAANAVGTVTTATNSANIVGSGTTFLTDYEAGDYIYLDDGTNNDTARINAVVNNTLMIASANISYANSTSTTRLFFPDTVPISLTRAGRTANTSGDQKTLYIDLGTTLAAAVNVAVTHSTTVANASVIAKTVTRNACARINIANNAGSTVGPWCVGIPDIFRLKGVYLSKDVATVNTNSTDVTSHFFIDHNQTEKYLDVGYLYKKPTSNLLLANNDALLVVFDCLTKATEGATYINSYPLDDTAELDTANTTMHTLEIPEVFGDDGQHYDLRDCIDFRPYVANTAAIVTTPASSTINPATVATGGMFGNTADPANNRKFVVPESDIFANITYYLARKDRVTITSNTDFTIMKGRADTRDKTVLPPAPASALTLGEIDVTPYPTLPTVLGADTAEYANTGVANERFTNRRVAKYTVGLTTNVPQPRVYRMADIGKLDRRLEALEYEAQLSEIEDSVFSKVIPSTSDPRINRFKFGFYVDNFTNDGLSEVNDPEYFSTIVDNRLTSKMLASGIPMQFNAANNTVRDLIHGEIATLPYVEFSAVNQHLATDTELASNVSFQQITTQAGASANTVAPTYANNIGSDIKTYVFSANNGAGVLYFDFFDGQPDVRIDIYQSTSDATLGSVVATVGAAVPVTDSEAATYLNNSVSADAFVGSSSAGVDYYRGAGKILVTHNAELGRYYTVKISWYTSSRKNPNFIYQLTYPFDEAVYDDASTPTPTPTTPTPPNYRGTMVINGRFAVVAPSTAPVTGPISQPVSTPVVAQPTLPNRVTVSSPAPSQTAPVRVGSIGYLEER